MIKHNNNSYYEAVLIILTLFAGVAFLQDLSSVKIFLSLFILSTYFVKEFFLFLQQKDRKEFEDKLQAIKETETQKEIDNIKSELSKINITLFKRQ